MNHQNSPVAKVVAQDLAQHDNPRAINHLYPIDSPNDLLAPGTKLYLAPVVTVDMVREVEHFCPIDLPHNDQLRWKAARLTELLGGV